VLGSHAQQKGSLVGPDRLRFDFTSPRALTPEELAKVEDLVNQRTLANHTVRTEVLNMDEARARGHFCFGQRLRVDDFVTRNDPVFG